MGMLNSQRVPCDNLFKKKCRKAFCVLPVCDKDDVLQSVQVFELFSWWPGASCYISSNRCGVSIPLQTSGPNVSRHGGHHFQHLGLPSKHLGVHRKPLVNPEVGLGKSWNYMVAFPAMELTSWLFRHMGFEWFWRPPKRDGKMIMMGVDPSGSGRLARKLPSTIQFLVSDSTNARIPAKGQGTIVE